MRSAADIGAGLAPARDPQPIRPGERIHVVGAAGAGASAAAIHANWAGAVVTACDAGGPSLYSAAFEAAGVPLATGHDARHITTDPPPDRLAVTKALTAVDPGHAELEAARLAGIPIEPWQQLIADAAFGKRLIAVAGTHGKSTTAGWLTHLLATAGRDPSAFVGALLPPSITGGEAATARRGRGPDFVVEADEYAGNFEAYRAQVVVVTNIEWDHPDVFADRAAVISAFDSWLRSIPDATLVANVSDAGAAELLARLAARPGDVIRAAVATRQTGSNGTVPDADAVAEVVGSDAMGTRIRLSGSRISGQIEVRLPTAGRHNVANAITVAASAIVLGLSGPEIRDGLATFPGVGRRLERKGEAAGVVVYDDYGHHPTAIRATIEAVRQREPGRRVWAVYEPLTFHRTAALLDEFAAALGEADAVAIADIWPGRDPDTTVASASGLAAAVAARRPNLDVAAPGSVEATADWLSEAVRPGDVVLVMGGGRSYRIGERLLARRGASPA
jgi:UDP-N-acetylmuramate--alanine ligase